MLVFNCSFNFDDILRDLSRKKMNLDAVLYLTQR